MSILLSWLTALFLLTLPAFAAGADASGPPPSVTVMLGTDGVADLDRGEIVAYDVREPTDKTLAAGLAMYVETPPERLIAAIQNGALLVGDPEVIAAGAILPDGGPEALEKFEFTPSDIGEVKALSEVGPGSEFNFSASEIEGFRALGRTLAQASEAEELKALSRHYRELLWRRADSYRKYGPEAIEPYARAGGSAVDVAAELRLFTEQDAVLLQYSPELRAALLRFPSALPPGAVSTLQWVKRKVDPKIRDWILDEATCCHFRAFFYTSATSWAHWLWDRWCGTLFLSAPNPGQRKLEQTSPKRLRRIALMTVVRYARFRLRRPVASTAPGSIRTGR